jgi:hypothetical protein
MTLFERVLRLSENKDAIINKTLGDKISKEQLEQ